MTLFQCPKCGEKLDCGPERYVCGGCATAWPVTNGIPRFFQAPNNYWGEVGRRQAIELLEAARQGSWKDAVRSRFPENDNMRFGLLDLQRASWAPMLGLSEHSTVVDIGSGYGAITHSLSRFAGEVYSIEAIPERIDFTRERLRQEGIANVHLVQASATALPLAENSFDLAVVNGVLEWVGDWDLTVDPRMVQLNFLKKIQRLLKKDGILLIGIENRFGLDFIRGNRDHSGLRYTSLVPRQLATFMLRLNSQTHYRTQASTQKQYRTYTYSESGYRTLLADAGFSEMSSYWADPGYNQPYDLTPLALPAWVRRHSEEQLRHPGLAPLRSWRRKVRRMTLPFLEPFVSDFVLVGSKQALPDTQLKRWIEQCLNESDTTRSDQAIKRGPIAWALHTKPFKDTSIARIGDAKTGSDLAYLKIFTGTQVAENPFALEVENRGKVQQSLSASKAALLRVPRFYGAMRVGATHYYLEEASPGSQISDIVREPGYFDNLQEIEKDFSQICDRILELTLALQSVPGVRTIPSTWRELPEIARSGLIRELTERRYFQQSASGPPATWVQHGDLSVENVHLNRKTGEFEVFDWCDLAGGLPPLYDFFHFFFSTGYLPRAAENIRFGSEEDRWIATFEALFFSDAAVGRLIRRLLMRTGARLNVSPREAPALLIEFLIIRFNYYQSRSAVQSRLHLRLLERCLADFEKQQQDWERSLSAVSR